MLHSSSAPIATYGTAVAVASVAASLPSAAVLWQLVPNDNAIQLTALSKPLYASDAVAAIPSQEIRAPIRERQHASDCETKDMSRRPSALIVANRLPFPIDDGWKTRAFHIAKAIGREFETTLLVFNTAPAALQSASEALGPSVTIRTVPPPRSYTISNLMLGVVSGLPVHVWNVRSRHMSRAVRAIALERSPSLCVFESTWLFALAQDLPATSIKLIDAHNVDTLIISRYAITLEDPLRRWYAGLTAPKIARFESQAFSAADLVWTCSEQDRIHAMRLAGSARFRVVPNGVDTRAFISPTRAARLARHMLFFGKLDYLPNEDGIRYFLRDIYPDIRAAVPDCRLDVVGMGASAQLKGLIQETEGVCLIGRVDDIRPVLAEAGVIIAPLRMGGGTRLKLIESLAMSCPVVTTSIGAEGLDIVHERDALVADDPREFAVHVVRLLQDPPGAAALGERGRQTVEQYYDWDRVLKPALEHLRSLAAQRAR
jgi:glycosyltransferase involved in cell wall biosynthesis